MDRSSTAGRSCATQAAARRSRDAFTLLELLVVMGIAAVLAGITAASYVGVTRRASREGARDNVMGVLRQARISAVDSGRGSVVRIDPASRSIYGIATNVIGAWHFEEVNGPTTPGAPQNNDGTLVGAPLPTLVSGKLGLALRFGGADYVDCGSVPIWNQTTGIRLEAWVNPSAPADEYIIAKTDGASGYSMGTDPDGSNVFFDGGVAFRDADGNPGGIYIRSADSYATGQWYHVAFEFDGFEARLFVNGVLADLDTWQEPEPAAVDDPRDNTTILNPPGPAGFTPPARISPARASALTIGCMDTAGGPTGYFTGDIDEPRVLSIAGGSPVTLPERVPLFTTDEVVHYNAQGFLDPAYHSDDVYVAVGDPYQAAALGADVTNAVGPGGTIALSGVQNPFPVDGCFVLLDGELIWCSAAPGGTLTVGIRNYPSGTVPAVTYPAGDMVYFARVADVTRTGLVQKQTAP